MSPMLCQSCQKNPATIHFTEIKDDQKRELHICEACANERGLATSTPGLIDFLQAPIRPPGPRITESCPNCGITFDEFRTKGRFGCPRDYDVFEEALNPLLDKIHQSHQHTGRLPRGRSEVETDTSDNLLRLRHEQQEAVRNENYEEAARLRDEIRALEEAQAADRAASSSGLGNEPSGGSR